ncbi:hypothetical protein H7X46_22790 [Pseudonocardia sp. C8]|uniref:hypothetical protein n=1 Tax=Pseudonocardia sp. C8 TaxID=2762759 RepID=UPI001642E150|nr:hypothetical protein [Pseudonocardia sp. C8]MBC3193892.1 hypothetical protein [Pseudonocardia sp. C8]
MTEVVRKRRPDVLTLVAGLLSLLVAAAGITGTGPWEIVDLRWLLAGTAVVAGIAFLVAGLRNSRGASGD